MRLAIPVRQILNPSPSSSYFNLLLNPFCVNHFIVTNTGSNHYPNGKQSLPIWELIVTHMGNNRMIMINVQKHTRQLEK